MNRAWFLLFLTPVISYAAYPAYEENWDYQPCDPLSQATGYVESIEAEEFDDFDAFAYEEESESREEQQPAPVKRRSLKVSPVAEEEGSYSQEQRLPRRNRQRMPRRSSQVSQEREQNLARPRAQSSQVAEEKESSQEQNLPRQNRQRLTRRYSQVGVSSSSQVTEEQGGQVQSRQRATRNHSAQSERPRITQRKYQKAPEQQVEHEQTAQNEIQEESQSIQKSPKNTAVEKNVRRIPQRPSAVKAKPYTKNRARSHHPGKRPVGE